VTNHGPNFDAMRVMVYCMSSEVSKFEKFFRHPIYELNCGNLTCITYLFPCLYVAVIMAVIVVSLCTIDGARVTVVVWVTEYFHPELESKINGRQLLG
jgi:hypothetical protein